MTEWQSTVLLMLVAAILVILREGLRKIGRQLTTLIWLLDQDKHLIYQPGEKPDPK